LQYTEQLGSHKRVSIVAHGKLLNMPKNDRIHTSSLVVIAIDIYSASVEDLETMVCLLVFHDIGEPPSITKYPMKDLLERGHVPQPESQNP